MSHQRVTRTQILQAALKDPEFEALWTSVGASLHAGELIATVRMAEGLTQTGLALKAGVPRPYVAMLENGHVNVTINRLETLLSAMGYTLVLEAKKQALGGAE